MRRAISAVLAAHKMDPRRYELYVEGQRDKTFLDWLVPLAERRDARVVLISSIEVPNTGEGGERQRLVEFLNVVSTEAPKIRGLVDADSYRLIEQPGLLPMNAWLTDYRDLEAYVLALENVQTGLQLGYGQDATVAPEIFDSMVRVARRVAVLRLVSENLDLDLPISAHKWLRYVRCNRFGIIDLDEDGVISSLLQAAHVSLARKDEIAAYWTELFRALTTVDNRDIIHGKDAMALLTRQFRSLGVVTDDVTPVLWTTFRREYVREHSILIEVVEFLRR